MCKLLTAIAPVMKEQVVKLTTKGRYAVMAMADLARHSSGSPVALAEIAANHTLSDAAERAGRYPDPITALAFDPAQEETRYWCDVAPNLRAIDIWIGEESDLGCGYGTEIMQLWLSRYFAKSEVTAVLIDPLISNTAAHRFYERLGFRRQQQRRFGPDDCYVYCLTRQNWALGELFSDYSNILEPLTKSRHYGV